MSWRTPITLVVLLVVLLGAAYYGWQTVISPATEDAQPQTTKKRHCENVEEFRKGQLIRSKDILVNVYNAGAIANLAGDTLETLKKRGFNPGVSANAPASVSATDVTIITTTPKAPQVQLVAVQFKGDVRFAKGGELAPGIDVIVGDDFKGMKNGAQRTWRVKHAISTCTEATTANS